MRGARWKGPTGCVRSTRRLNSTRPWLRSCEACVGAARVIKRSPLPMGPITWAHHTRTRPQHSTPRRQEEAQYMRPHTFHRRSGCRRSSEASLPTNHHGSPASCRSRVWYQPRVTLLAQAAATAQVGTLIAACGCAMGREKHTSDAPAPGHAASAAHVVGQEQHTGRCCQHTAARTRSTHLMRLCTRAGMQATMQHALHIHQKQPSC